MIIPAVAVPSLYAALVMEVAIDGRRAESAIGMDMTDHEAMASGRRPMDVRAASKLTLNGPGSP